jgi:lipoprotein-releasing system permease protein
MQDLYGHPHKVQGFDVKLAAGENVDDAVGRVRAALPAAGFTVRSWEESFQDFLWILALEKNMLLLLLLCVELVASFMVMSLLLVLVIKKTREIGLLSALGGQPRQVALCFAAQGLFTGLVGTGLGLGFGFLILDFRNELVRGITTVIGGQDALVKFYQFQQLPKHLENRDLVVTILASLFLSTLAGLIPAWRAGRLNPVEALRGE